MHMSRPWMPLYVADYKADTAHLSTAEHGAYLLLIMHYWSCGGLPGDERKLARIVGMSFEEWEESRATIKSLFQDGWRHKRIDLELAKAAEKSASARESASKRWSKSRDVEPTECDGNANAHANAMLSQPQSQSHIQNITISDEIVSSASCDADPAPEPKISRCKREGVASSAILEIGSSWNNLASSIGLPQIDTIDGDRKRSVDARARELAANYEFQDPVAGFAFLFAKVRGSPFLCGQVPSRDGRPAFRATFDWCVSPKNFRKIMEGNYENQVVKPFPLLARA
jgi:uncharacterized protein YdaU (DUF1376 family)